MEWRGTYVVTITPFTKKNELDEEGIRQHVEWLITEGIHGIICVGSTGEFLCLSDAERRRVVEVTVDQARKRVPVLAGCTAEATPDAIRWAKHAEGAGADGAMIAPPFYCNPDPDELFTHYRAIAEAVRFPIMLYNYPPASGVDMVPPFVARLAEIENIRYIKESTTDVRRVRDILRLTDGRMKVFAGILAYESWWVGSTGWVSVVANVVPKKCARMFELVANERNLEAGLALYKELMPLMVLNEEGKYVQIPKVALNMMGRPGGGLPRPPRLPLSGERLARLEGILKELKLI